MVDAKPICCNPNTELKNRLVPTEYNLPMSSGRNKISGTTNLSLFMTKTWSASERVSSEVRTRPFWFLDRSGRMYSCTIEFLLMSVLPVTQDEFLELQSYYKRRAQISRSRLKSWERKQHFSFTSLTMKVSSIIFHWRYDTNSFRWFVKSFPPTSTLA